LERVRASAALGLNTRRKSTRTITQTLNFLRISFRDFGY
jgi:hypothetical protein